MVKLKCGKCGSLIRMHYSKYKGVKTCFKCGGRFSLVSISRVEVDLMKNG